jgi:hypothetical protein
MNLAPILTEAAAAYARSALADETGTVQRQTGVRPTQEA